MKDAPIAEFTLLHTATRWSCAEPPESSGCRILSRSVSLFTVLGTGANEYAKEAPATIQNDYTVEGILNVGGRMWTVERLFNIGEAIVTTHALTMVGEAQHSYRLELT